MYSVWWITINTPGYKFNSKAQEMKTVCFNYKDDAEWLFLLISSFLIYLSTLFASCRLNVLVAARELVTLIK